MPFFILLLLLLPGSFQYQLTGVVNTSVNAAYFDLDGFDTSSTIVATLHVKGSKVICYIDAGTWENWRSDASKFPSSVKGRSNGWPGEKWLDVRQLSVLIPIMSARADMCKQKGFDVIEWDNVDGYDNSSGFSLKATDQLTYNRALAQMAHNVGLSVLLKNDLDQASMLQSSFDALLLEQCQQYHECSLATPFISAGKPVWDVEYSNTYCKPYSGITVIQKTLDVTEWVRSCA